MLRIQFNDANDLVTSVAIDDKIYLLRVTWNQHGKFWTLHIWDKDSRPLLTNTKIVPNFPITYNKHCFDIPNGEFFVLSRENPTRESFKNGNAVLVYVTKEEWEDGSV